MTAKTRANFQSGQATTFADNTAGDISAADLRAEMVNLSDSALFVEDLPYGLDADDIDDAATTKKFTTAADISKLAGIEALADVTDTANVTAAGALMDSEVGSLSGIKTLTVPDNTSISAFIKTLLDDADAAAALATLGLTALAAAIRAAVADTTALAAIAEANCSDGMVVLVKDTGTLWRYDAAEDGTDADAVFPGDDGDGVGAWVPFNVFRIDFDTASVAGTLAVERFGGDSSGGDAAKFLNELGAFAVPSGAISEGTSDPASAPSATKLFYLNTTSGDLFYSVGTSSAADWKKLLNVDSIQAISSLSTSTTVGADYLLVEKDSDGSLEQRTFTNVIADHSLVTASSTTTMTNKTLTNPKASYTANALGTISSGTVTPSVANGNLETYMNNGAHTLAPPSAAGVWILTITNGASAGTITTSGYTAVKGDSFTTTNGHKFICTAVSDGTNSVLTVQALQ